MMRLLEGLTMTLDEGRKEGAAEVSLDLSFSDKASGYDGPILWQMLRLTEEFWGKYRLLQIMSLPSPTETYIARASGLEILPAKNH